MPMLRGKVNAATNRLFKAKSKLAMVSATNRASNSSQSSIAIGGVLREVVAANREVVIQKGGRAGHVVMNARLSAALQKAKKKGSKDVGRIVRAAKI